MRRDPFPLALLVLFAALALDGCRSLDAERGDQRAAVGDWDGAVAAYRAAVLDQPDNRRVAAALDAAERRAAAERVRRGNDRLAAGDLPLAVGLYEEAVRLDPLSQLARAAVARARPRLEEARRAIVEGRMRLESGDAIGAERTLAPLRAFKEGFPEVAELYAKARKSAAAALRERAAKLLEGGDVARANDALAQAKQLETAETAEPVALAAASGAGPDAKVLIGAPALDAYGEAAAQVKALTDGLPRNRPQGLAKPEDYALPEEKLPALRTAVEAALAARPAGERQPAWLAHGRLCLQMTLDVAATHHMETAKHSLEVGQILDAYRELEAARALDREQTILAQYSETATAIRMNTAKALLLAADRAEADGLHHLAKLRARQATEVDPAAARAAAEVVARADARGGAPCIAVLPFQNYTGRDGLEERFYARLVRKLEADGAAGVLAFDLYRKRKEAGLLPPLAAIVRGELVKLDAEAKDADLRARIEVMTERARAARRRVRDAATADARAAAQNDADEAERLLARAERERAASLFATSGGGRRLSGPTTLTIELRAQLYDPKTGAAEPIARSASAEGRDPQAAEDALLDQAIEPVAAAVEARLRASAASARDRAPLDPREALDERIAELERGPVQAGAPSVIAVLEATGYSFAEKRTMPDRLRID
jgi:hypothetical protein